MFLSFKYKEYYFENRLNLIFSELVEEFMIEENTYFEKLFIFFLCLRSELVSFFILIF